LNTLDHGTLTGQDYFTLIPGIDGSKFYDQYFLWSIFDGTTNAPVVFPSGTSLDNLENQILVHVLPDSLPFGIVNVPYSTDAPVQFTATGGSFTPPFTWTNDDGVLSGIGLTLSPDGTLSGTPTQSGTFDFTIILTDVNARSVSFVYTITIQ
jgi:hypothetical protein